MHVSRACAVIVRPDGDTTTYGDVHPLSGDLDQLHLQLLARGPYSEIVDESAAAGAVPRWQLLVFHLPPGGRLVSRLPSAQEHPGARQRLLSLIDDVVSTQATGPEPPVLVRTDQRPRREQDLHALAASLGEVVVDGDQVSVVRSDVETVSTVHERLVNDLLTAWPDLGAEILTVPAADDAPPLSIRSFGDVVLAPRQIACSTSAPRVVLPSTFRDPSPSRPHLRSLVDWSARSVLAPVHAEPTPLPGTWFHFDNVMRGHFGHAMTEQLSLAWAWEQVRARYPDVRAVAFSWPDHPEAAWEQQLFAAAGIDRYTVLPGPVRVDTLVTATPAYAIGSYLHPELHATWARTGAALESLADAGPRPERVFLSRSGDKRTSLDAAAIEQLATDHGFVVLRPETLPLPTQVAMVRSAAVVAGYAGSAMFHLALTARGPRTGSGAGLPVVVISSDTYPASNEQQICRSLGHHLTLVRGRSLVREGRLVDRLHSDYSLDEPAWAQLREAFATA